LEESPLDFFGTGHSSTSISAALGLAIARDYEVKILMSLLLLVMVQ
jgi:deoxyxylulose-5-phosphate synthase